MPALTRRSFALLSSSSLAGLLLAGGKARAEEGRAPDVVILCDVTLRPVLQSVGQAWRSKSGVPLRILTAPRTDMLIEEIARGQRSDLLVALGDDNADAAVQRKLMKPETRFDAWRNRLVIASLGPTGTPVPLTAGDLAALLASGALAAADPALSPAGANTRLALAKLGVPDSALGGLKAVESTGAVAALVKSGDVRLGIVYATDVAADSSLSVVVPLPDDSYPPLIYAVALTGNALSSQSSQFRAFLQDDATRAIAKAGGLEVLG